MHRTEEMVFKEICEMLYQTYPDSDISMETWLEFGEGTYLDMSSIEIVQFIIDLEEKYSIIIDIEDRYYSVGDTVRGVVSYLREKGEDISKETLEETCESEL